MPRVVSLFLPTWPTDRVRRNLGAAAPSAEAPLVLIGREGRRRVVLAADRAALAAGLRVGMPATKAQALVKGLIIRTRSRRQIHWRSNGWRSGRCAMRRLWPPIIPMVW